MAIVIGVLFVIGQGVVFFFYKEHKRDIEVEKKAERPKFADMFRVLRDNRYTRVMIVSFFCYILRTTVMTALITLDILLGTTLIFLIIYDYKKTHKGLI